MQWVLPCGGCRSRATIGGLAEAADTRLHSGVNRLVRISLRTKWTLALLLAGGLPLLLSAFATVRIQQVGLEIAEQDREVAVIDNVALRLHSALDATADDVHRIGQTLTEPLIADPDVRIRLGTDILQNSSTLSAVALYGAQGQLLDMIVRGQDIPVANAPGQAAPRPVAPEQLTPEQLQSLAGQKTGTWHQPLQKSSSGSAVVLHYLEPILKQKQVQAYMLGIVSGRELEGEAHRAAIKFCNEVPDCVLVLDRDLTILAGGTAEGPLARGKQLAGKDMFARLPSIPSPIEEPMVMSTEFTGPSGEKMVGSLRMLPQYQWLVVVRRPAAQAFKAMQDVQLLLLLSTGFLVAVAVVLGGYFAKRATNPIAQLMKLTQAYAQRRFSERAPITSGDELQELGRSMTDMAVQLQASEVEIERRTRIENGLSRFLPQEVAQSIAAGHQSLSLGGQRRNITVLFADVVAFTRFAESSSPEKVVAFLNELFTVLAEVIFRNEGIVDKFIGDCVMAIFGAPNAVEDHCGRALATAEAIHRFVEANAPAWKTMYGIEVQMAIGVSTGEVLVGNLGSETRMEYTAIGDAVNIAARLEGLAQPGQTLVTAEVAAAAGDAWQFHSIGEHPLRGRKKPVQILEVV